MNTSAPTLRCDTHRVRSLFLFAFVFVVATATLRAQGTAVRVETFSLRANGEVSVENPRGATRVESWDQQTVRVVAEKTAPPASRIEPGELVLMGAQNSVIVACKPGAGRIDLTLYVPRNALLQVTGGAWPVAVDGSLAGAVVDTTSGNIAYRLPANDDARVALRSAQGTVRSAVSLAAIERAGTRSLRGQIGSGTAQLILNSQNGNVTLTPGPAIARAANDGTNAIATNTHASGGAIATQSEDDSRTRGAQRTNGSAAVEKNDPAQPRDFGVGNTGVSSPAPRSNGSVVFAGSDRSDDSSSTTTNGPLVRPRRERNTGGGNSGLNVRIIPSNAPPRSSADSSVRDSDQSTDDLDAQKGSQPSGRGAASGSRGSSSNQGYPSSGSVVFAGSDRADNSSSKTRGGPLERDRQTKDTSGGNSGLRVRIIPANAPPGPSRDSSSIFDPRDESPQVSTDDPIVRGTSQTRAGQGTRSDRDPQQRSTVSRRDASARADVDGDRDEIASSKSRAGAPPVLNRTRIDDSSGAPASGEAGPPPKNADEEAIVLKASLVNLNVSVTNRAGVALSNLKKEDFDVAENGEAQKIEFFQPTTAPFNLVLVLDLSGSIKEKLDIVKSAALRFLEVLGPQDKIAVVTFTDEIRVVSQLTNDRDELKRRIKLIDRSQGGTAFYEALWFSLMDTLRGTRGQRNAVVVMTDGVDSSLDRYNPMDSRVTFNQLARRLEESDVIVFPIYLDTEYEEVFERGNSTSEAYAVARDQLERVSELTGGQMFKAEKASDLSGVYKRVAAAIRTVYSVGYYPTNPERDGTFRRVRVGVSRSDAAVRTRKGYYAK